MASSQPIVRQAKWIFVIPQLIIFIMIICILDWIGVEEPLLSGVVIYLLIFLALKNIIPRHHRMGIRLFKSEQYNEAVQEFQKSYDFFLKHKWIDRYRFIVLLSSSRISYLEMALLNMAYCYGQLGEGLKSRKLYEKTLEQFPDSKMAKAAIKMLESAKDI